MVDNPNIFADKYKLKSSRLKNYDYSSSGIYFITICTYRHNNFFGKITDNQMELSKMGMITNQCLIDIPKHFKNVLICESIIMPNHIHLLLELTKFNVNSVETRHGASLTTNQTNIKSINLNQQKYNLKETPYLASLQEHSNQILIRNSQRNTKQNKFNHVETRHGASLQITYQSYHFHRLAIKSNQTIPKIINQFKSAVTKRINPKTVFFAWQPRYHDIIIKDEKQYFTIKNYIKNNVINWEKDKYFSR